MAINIKDYEIISDNIKIHKKDNSKFLFDFRLNNKRYRKVIKIQATNWTKRDYIKEAKIRLSQMMNEIEQGYNPNDKIKFNQLFELYCETIDTSTAWNKKKIQIYEYRIKPAIGNKQVKNIKEIDIQRIIKQMQKENLKPATQKKILEVLHPVFKFAIKNKIIQDNPLEYIKVKVPSQKKIVTNASEKFKLIYHTILEVYKNDPFYRAFFLFGFSGRRKGEVIKLKWENIDLDNNYYWLETTKNNESQKFPLLPMIKTALLELPRKKKGLVFESPITGKELKNTDRQMKKLKKATGIEELSYHYMRNVLVSALAEQNTEAIILSGVLGHKDVNTINKYLSLNYYQSGLKAKEIVSDLVDIEVVE